jgi:hypothetical protein
LKYTKTDSELRERKPQTNAIILKINSKKLNLVFLLLLFSVNRQIYDAKTMKITIESPLTALFKTDSKGNPKANSISGNEKDFINPSLTLISWKANSFFNSSPH